MAAPLSGVRVVELTSWMAAPSAGAILADLGAEVVKIEPPGGDPVRGLIRPPKVPEGTPKIDYSFHIDNRGKQSVVIAIDQPEGAGLVRRLVTDAHVFLCNLLPNRQERYGLDAATLRARESAGSSTPRSTGYGMTGPDAGRPGYDVTAFFGRGAITDGLTEPGGTAPAAAPRRATTPPDWPSSPASSPPCAWSTQTGEGQTVDVSLLGTAVWTMATELSGPLIDGREPTKRDRHHLISPLANRFRCQRRSMDRAEHARDPLVAAVLRRHGPARVVQGPSLRDGQEPLRQHAGPHRQHRRGVRHQAARRVGSHLRRGEVDLGTGVHARRTGRATRRRRPSVYSRKSTIPPASSARSPCR